MTTTSPQDAFYRELGQNIRACRKRNKLSQEALAQLIGLTRTSLTNIESGRQHPPLHTFCAVVAKLKVDFAELLPHPRSAAATIDIKAMLGDQLRGEGELAFIKTGIGITNRGSHGDTETKDSGDGGITSR